MNSQLAEIQQQRAALLAQIASQREEMTHITRHWKTPMSLVDRGLEGVRWLQTHPLALVGLAGAAGLVLLRRGSVVGLVMGVWRGWKFYQRTKAVLSKARQT